jgi:hypothetical protein
LKTDLNLTSIAIVTCWYGLYPWYFPYFIHSCKFNPTIDFIIITNNDDSIQNKPQNVKIIRKTLDEIKTTASEKLGLTVHIENPYKLCDYKPAYGFLFSEIIKGYDFWGQSDIDVIYGNIRNFMTDEMLNKYDFISIRHDYTSGCFALYRNNTQMNTIFKRSKDYETVFTNSKHYCFDECNFVWDELTNGKSIFEVKTEIESFTHIIKTAEKNSEIQPYFDFMLIEGLVGKIKFDNGKIIYKNLYEGILYHLYWLKRIYCPAKIPKQIPNVYHISSSRIYKN